MANKTPAMILQELSIKKCGLSPTYDLITQHQGTHENEFEFLVEVLGISATGRGRSKKDAKQETARNALIILQEDPRFDFASTSFSPQEMNQQILIEDDLPQVKNYIGDLGDLCLVNKLPMPTYELILDDGPPHHKVFTYECRMGHSLVLRYTASTKKQAKQHLAKMMLERIQDIVPAIHQELENEQLKLCANDTEAVEQYKNIPSYKRCNFDIQVRDYYLHLTDWLTEKNISYDDIKTDLEPPYSLEKLVELCKKLGLEVELEDLSEEKSPVNIVVINVSTNVSLCALGMGKTKEQATANALQTIYREINTLSKPL